jgi:phosphoribosylformylglycinamidine synthase PurS subunit
MARLTARVIVTPKPVVNDPQGITVRGGLHRLGFDEVSEVRVGKYIELQLEAADEEEARRRVNEMCRKLLANHVIEDVRFQVDVPDSNHNHASEPTKAG